MLRESVQLRCPICGQYHFIRGDHDRIGELVVCSMCEREEREDVTWWRAGYLAGQYAKRD